MIYIIAIMLFIIMAEIAPEVAGALLGLALMLVAIGVVGFLALLVLG